MARRKGEWRARAERVIAEIDAVLPAGATVRERRAALREGYPFGERRCWPYKVWLQCQRAYLARCAGLDPASAKPLDAETTPLFFWTERAEEKQNQETER